MQRDSHAHCNFFIIVIYRDRCHRVQPTTKIPTSLGTADYGHYSQYALRVTCSCIILSQPGEGWGGLRRAVRAPERLSIQQQACRALVTAAAKITTILSNNVVSCPWQNTARHAGVSAVHPPPRKDSRGEAVVAWLCVLLYDGRVGGGYTRATSCIRRYWLYSGSGRGRAGIKR